MWKAEQGPLLLPLKIITYHPNILILEPVTLLAHMLYQQIQVATAKHHTLGIL